MRRSVSGIAVGMLLLAPGLGAQVGHTPETSPFRDLAYRQELSLSGGYFSGANDPAGVAPGGGGILTARYEIRVSGPLLLSGRVSRAFSKRTVVEFPEGEDRLVETRPWPLHFIEAGFAIVLTGAKSYHNLVPVVGFHGGVATDFGKAKDSGGFEVGTPFALAFDGGVRWHSGGNVQLRATVASNWYQVKYPDSYFTPPDGGTALLPEGSAQRVWNRSTSLSIGVAYLFLR